MQNTRHLLGLEDQFTVVAAFLEKDLRVSFLKNPVPISRVGMCEAIASTGHAAMAIKQTIDQVQIARPQLPRTQ